MRKSKAVYKGRSKYAKVGCKCRTCGKWLAKGKRKANQFLCCKIDSRDLTECQRTYYKNKRAQIAKNKPKPDYGFVICDICQAKTKKTDHFQKRCTSGKKGVMSECQKEGRRRNSNKNSADIESLYPTVYTKKRDCLRCGKKFDSLHVHNRICDKCTIINDRGVRKEHKLLTGTDRQNINLDLVEIFKG